MRFDHHDVQRFAAWSGDRNPLHVDPDAARRSVFGQPVVHGMLTAIRALTSPAREPFHPRRIAIEFRSAVFTDRDYTLEPSGDALILRDNDHAVMTLHVHGQAADPAPRDGWGEAAGARRASLPRVRQQPAVLEIGQLAAGVEVTGVYETAAPPDDYLGDGRLHPLQARVLGLCSYVVGMEIPGLRSLFTRLSVIFAGTLEDTPELLFRARAARFDPNFRILDVTLDVVTPDGTSVASGELRSYVRFSPVLTDPAALAGSLSEDAKRLHRQVALVCGGSRGLGADLSAALAGAGVHVYAAYRRDGGAARELQASVEAAGGTLDLLEGDVADRAWCESTRQAIVDRHGHLDILVLNACAPPTQLRLSADTGTAWNDYISSNVPLAQVPLATLLPTLADSNGTVVCISSSFVTDPPAGFGHYVALKEAVEATVRAAARETPGLRAIVARPPRLQTAWNDTPTGVLGTIPSSQAAVAIVNRLGNLSSRQAVDILSDFPAISAARRSPAAPAAQEFFLGLSASFTAEPLLDGLNFWFRELGVAGEIEVAPYGQILQTLLSPDGGLSRRPGMHVVMLRLRDWLRELAPERVDSAEFLAAYLESTATDLERALRTHRAQAPADTLLVLCPSAPEHEDAAESLLARTEEDLVAKLAALPGLTVVRARDFHELYEVDEGAIADHFREHIAHIPYQSSYFHVLATVVIRHVHRRLTHARKVVVVDCDNTLWRGVVGEVGAEGLAFDDGHAALHEALVRLGQAGVLVALCSKNEEADVWRVFETRAEMALRREHVVAASINWQPKSANLRAMAERLNLGLDSFVFIDDNPVECAEVRAACPDVLTIEWPQDAAQARRLLRHVWELDSRGATDEDKRRTELYKEEFKRQELQQTLTFRDFIASLDLVVDIAPLAEADVKRAAQLTLRTNQFNFTTRRREEGEMQALAAAGTHEIRTVRVRDRFGDYGLVGLLIAEARGGEVFADTFLLSCRVLGRGVEHQMVAEFGRIAEARGAAAVRLRVDPTKRNTPARTFLLAVAPDEFRTVSDDGTIEAVIPADVVTATTFEPPEQSGPAVVEDKARAAAPVDGAQLRSREARIRRAAFEMATPADLVRAIEGRPAPAAAAAAAPADTSFVYEAFAAALNMSAERVKDVDSLEALGCDSFKIVEITVGLLERFPALPGTLLFEHRSVSEIAKRIGELAAGGGEPRAASDSAARLRPRERGAAGAADIAVVGLHVRTAGAHSAGELWALLSGGGVAAGPVPSVRKYFLGRLEDERPHFAGLLDDLDRFDAELFGITPREAELMDPQLRLFLEVAWGALEDAGCLGDRLEPDTGVFAGVMYADYGYRANLVAREAENPFKCWEGFSLANRLSQVFGFQGPSIAVDTACSSSGTAVHLACRALAYGDCRVAIAGGVNLILDPDRFVQLGRLGILSLSGRCLAFGAEADGTILGEGAGVVVLRPLADAIARGDRIYGVIKGTGVSTGSGTVGFTAPNPVAQATAIRRAVRAAGIDPRSISYVETHGTGTALGDPIEVRGLTLAYTDPDLWDGEIGGRQACTIGSIKPNIGHLEAGAGVLGLIKVLLQLHRRTLLPSVTSESPNPQIPFAQTPFSIQRTLAPWEAPVMEVGGAQAPVPRRAALNSFGVGGANAHVIVEEAPAKESDPGLTPSPRPLDLLAVAARTPESLNRRLEDLAAALERDPALGVADVAYSINTGQRLLPHRAVITARSREEMIAALGGLAAGDEPTGTWTGAVPRTGAAPKIAFLFTGQGSQYAGMGRELYETQPVFRAALDRCLDVFEPLLDGSLRATLFAADGTPDAAHLNQTGFTQPALFSLGYALSEMWRSWGIRPDVVMGHSIGELTAMCVAGGMSLEDGARMVAARGRLMQALPPGGAMISVMTTEDRALDAIAGVRDRVAVAALNGPTQTVISGEAAAVAAIAARFEADGVKSKALVVSHAFHSPLMTPMLADYEAVLRTIHLATPATTFVSCVLGRIADAELTTSEYWLRNVIDPVRFTDGVRVLDGLGVAAFVEIGPQPILLGMGRQCLAAGDDGGESARMWLPSIRKDAAWAPVLSSLGQLFLAGAAVDWQGFDAPYGRTRVTVPAYPFAGRRYWIGAVPAVASFNAGSARETVPGAATYEIAWRERPADRSPVRPEGHWVVFADAGGLGADLSRRLEQGGARGTVVSGADGSAGDPGAVLARLELEPGGIRGVVDLRSLDAGVERDPAGAATLVVEHAIAIMRGIADLRVSPDARLWMVTRHAVEGVGPHPIDPAQAALWGAGRTFALEHPRHWGGLVDVAAATADAAIQGLIGALSSSDAEDQIALGPKGPMVPRLTRRDRQPPSSPLVISPDGAYIVTGGLGALGLHTARWLAARGARRLVLTSRAGRATPGAGEAVHGLEALGAIVTVVAADVSRPEGVAALFDAVPAGTRVAGIFHAAGIDETKPIAEMKPGDVARVMAAKTAGAWLLHERTRGAPLDVFVCFSSIASVLGSAGRASYAAANAFLDGLALERRRLGLPAISINWGPWAGGGMATSVALDQYGRVGNRGLDPSDAIATMEALLAGGPAQAAVADIDWQAFRAAYEARRARPLIAELVQQAPASAAHAATTTTGAPAWVARLSGLPDESRLEALTELLRAEIAQTLGFDGAADVAVDRPFRDMGMDSLMSADFAQRLQKRAGVRATALVFDHPTVTQLAPSLLGQLELAVRPAPEPALATAGLGVGLAGAPGLAPEGGAGLPPGVGRFGTSGGHELPAAPPVTSGEEPGRTEGYRPEVEPDVFEFQKLAWPKRRADWIAPRWRWMFVDSARRLGVAPQVWLHRHNGAIVGHNGAIPVRLKVGREERTTAWLVDTMVLEAYRSQAVGARLMVEAHADLPFALSLGQTEQMRAIQLRMGWRQVAPLETAQLLLRPERVLRGKLPAPAAIAAGIALRASGAMRDALRQRSPARVRTIGRFEAAHDEIWTAMAAGVTCAVRRDASYLNWKYVDQPGQDFLRLEVTSAGGARGIVVLMFREPDEAYVYRRAFIVDVVAPLSNAQLMAAMIEAAGEAATAREADAVLCLHAGAMLTAALEAAGYRLRQPSRYLLVLPGPVPGELGDDLLSADQWFITQGDSDIDRPW